MSEEIMEVEEQDDGWEPNLEDALESTYVIRDFLFHYIQTAAAEEQDEIVNELSELDNRLHIVLYFLEKENQKLNHGDDENEKEDLLGGDG